MRVPLASRDVEMLTAHDWTSLEYFASQVWPLLSASPKPCPPPISLAIESKPVLFAVCALAEAHRTLQYSADQTRALTQRRQKCLAAVRGQLSGISSGKHEPSTVLLSVLLLYFLDGLVDCNQQYVSTQSHFTGATAIIDAFGNFGSVLETQGPCVGMLLSALVSTDLTNAVLHGRRPSFPGAVWQYFDTGTVWWYEDQSHSRSLASVCGSLSRTAFYFATVQDGSVEFSLDKVKELEKSLQPSYQAIDVESLLEEHDGEIRPKTASACTIDSDALFRAFQHAGLIFLYRAVCFLPTGHFLVQQHVRACLNSVFGIDKESSVQNCTFFPLFVAGAHSLSVSTQHSVKTALEDSFVRIKFGAITSILAYLQDIWTNDRASGGWLDTFLNVVPDVLVL